MTHATTGRERTDERPLALLDIGSSKVCCLIVAISQRDGLNARIGAPLGVRKLGFGTTGTRGIRAGCVTDLSKAEESIKQAVAQAEAEAGLSIEQVVVASTCGQLRSVNFAASTDLPRGVVSVSDIDKVLAAGKAFVERDGRELMHMHRLGFRVDGREGIRNPRGLPGQRMSMDLNAVAADEVALRNLRALLARSYLTVSNIVAAPYASGLATLTDDDLRMATVAIDLGAGTTTFAIFDRGVFQHAGGIALGGEQITLDIARSFSILPNQAERIKALYGNLVGAMSDEHEYLPALGASSQTAIESRITRAQLRRVIAPRIEEMLQLVRERVLASGLLRDGLGRVVLTGGASQISGLGVVAAQKFGCEARIGRPLPMNGMAQAAVTPAMGAVMGLAFAVLVPGALPNLAEARLGSPVGYLGRLGKWFKDSFWDDEQPAGAA